MTELEAISGKSLILVSELFRKLLKKETELMTEGTLYVIGGDSWIGSKYKKKNYNKIRCPEKFTELATHYSHDVSFAKTKCGKIYILRENGSRWKSELTSFTNFNQCFEFSFNISYEPLKEKFSHIDNFVQNGTYQNLFSELEEIVKDSFGTVFKVKSKRNNCIYAVKRMISQEDNEEVIIKEFEIFSLVKKLDNKYVVRFIDAWLEDYYPNGDGKNRLSMFISMEYCETNLKDLISEINKNVNFKKRNALTPVGYFLSSQIFKEILQAVNYLHSQNPPIIHRDLKPANILFDKEINGSHVRIADFGAMVIHKYDDELHTSDKGSPKYTAPEVVTGRKYHIKADVYSLGIVLEELFSLDIDR